MKNNNFGKSEINYEHLYTKYRDDLVIKKSEEYAMITLASIFPDVLINENGERTVIEKDYQSLGATLVDTLANKLATTLFPINQPFFRLTSSDGITEVLAQQGIKRSDVSQFLSKLENSSYKRLWRNSSYSQLVYAIKNLIITGNCLVYRDTDESKTHVYTLRQYTIKRDGSGKVRDIVLKEIISKDDVPEDLHGVLHINENTTKNFSLFTRIKRESRDSTDVMVVSQQIEGYEIPDAESEYPISICPYIPVTWNLITGENYGRGRVEDYIADLIAYSELSRAATEYDMEMAKMVNIVSPTSQTDVDELDGSESGDYVTGIIGDIQTLEKGSYQKSLQLRNNLATIAQRLQVAFMYSANTRDAERVTALEIQANIREADTALGGAYSTLSDTMQVPLANVILFEENPSYVQGLIDNEISIDILTGNAALGRSTDVNNLLQATASLAQAATLTQLDNTVNIQKIADMFFSAYGVDIADLRYTEEELRSKEQAAQQAQANINSQQSAVSTGLDAAQQIQNTPI